MKPRLFKSFWRALASTHPLMLFPREVLFAPPPSSEKPAFTVESTLFSHAPALTILSHQGVALAHLDSLPPHNLVIWTDGSAPFPFVKDSSGALVNCSRCGTEAPLSFSAGPVCSSFSAEACVILQALCWFWRHQQVCHFSSL